MADGGRVGEAGMQVSSLHGDLGRPSVLRTVDSKAEGAQGAPRYPTGATGTVGGGASRSPRDQGVGWGRSSDDAPGNRGRAKGPWSAKADAEKASGEVLPKEGTGMAGNPTRPLRKTAEGGGAQAPEQAERRRGPTSVRMPRWEGQKLHSMMPFVFRRKTMVAAWEEVRKNRGAPGVDGESVEEFGAHEKERLWELSEALRRHEWQPKPLRRVWIPKPDGTRRGLAIPCVEDRVVHVAVAKVLYAVFEDEFGKACYAYVKGRSALDAVERVWTEARAGKGWVVETDVKKFFDTIDRKRLVDKVAVRIADGSFLRLVSAIIRSGVLGEDAGDDAVGVPQGSPLSPILANIYLAAFDRKIGPRWTLIRYADDLVVLCRTKEGAERARTQMEAALKEEGLSMKAEKTRVVRIEKGVEFLGYRLTWLTAEPTTKAMKRYQEKVRALTVRHDTAPLEEVVKRVMPVIRGWTNYYRLTTPRMTVWDLGGWTIKRLQAYVVKHRWAAAGTRLAPTETLYRMGLQLPYGLLMDWSHRGRESRMP